MQMPPRLAGGRGAFSFSKFFQPSVGGVIPATAMASANADGGGTPPSTTPAKAELYRAKFFKSVLSLGHRLDIYR
jgi:hypothetical protein